MKDTFVHNQNLIISSSLRHCPARENIMTPPIIAHITLPHQFITSNLRQNHSPYNPIYRPRKQDSNPDDTVKIIRERFIDVLTLVRRHEGSNNEVDVREEEEDGDGEGGSEGWFPGLRVAVDREGV